MKYALIVMCVVYLVTFGCNPKTEEKDVTTHDEVENAVVTEVPAPPAQLTATTTQAGQTTPEAGPDNKWNTAGHKTPAVPAAVQLDEKKSDAAVTTETEQSDQWKDIAQSAANTLLALMNDDQSKQIKPAQPTKKSVETTETTTILPDAEDMVQNEAAEAELSEAMEKMVDATNHMVTVTRQLVLATQHMLKASKEVAVEVIDTGKEAIETSQPALQDAVDESEIIETVKEVVSATKEAFEATSEAFSNALEAQTTEPTPGAIPQQ